MQKHSHVLLMVDETWAASGVACVDAQGLCLHEAGTVPKSCSGSIADLARHAFALVGADAVVTCDAAQGKVVLSRSEGGVVIALFMEPRVC